MNDRIKELVAHIGTDSSGKWVSIDNVEKFSEMIVRECMTLCKSRVGNSDYNTGRMHCVSDIKEHFQVKE